ncbi:MAG: enoyl-CoA hydratase/isomerase family protein [Leptospiraceae bacterium]|nr:enoyl-CoA hydratase/isomerase family protein [Leptospiraceae bacterium]
MNYQFLKIEKPKVGLVLVKINRPQALNALNVDLLRELENCISEAENDPANRILVLTGEGEKAFVAGADIAAMKEYDQPRAEDFSELGQSVFNKFDQSRLITIAAINGFALGGGMELALSCDLRIGSNKAKLGLPEVSLGLIPGFGGTQRLGRLVGVGRAMEIILSGDMISAEEAYRIGIINRISEPEALMDTVWKLTDSILSRGPIAIQEAKRIIKNGIALSPVEGFRIEKLAFAGLFSGKESKEGLGAFLEKRKPNF